MPNYENKQTRLLLIILYFINSFMSSINIHKGAKVHSHCQVCIVHRHLHSNIPSTPIIYTNCIQCSYEAILFKLEPFQVIIDKGFNSNAPPLFSYKLKNRRKK